MKKYIPTLDIPYILKGVLLFLVYFLTAKIGLSFYAVSGFATTVWPPTGIALAALILYGYDLWPAITIAAFVVNYQTGASPLVALGIAIGNTLEAVIGTYFLRKYITLYRCFERLPDTLRFIGIVVVVGASISATIGVASLYFGDVVLSAAIPQTWFTWWIGDALGALVVAPCLLTCLRPTRKWNKDSLSWIEIVSGYSFLLISSLLIFWYPVGQVKSIPLLYLLLFPLIWAGIRFGSRGITTSILVTSIIAVVSTAYGHGPFIMNPIGDGLLSLQIFLGTISITFLIFISIVKERRQSMEKLREHVDELEQAVEKISSSDKAKNDFLAMLGHELRNPLAPILSSLEIIRLKSNDNPEISRIIKTVETHAHTMVRLLDDLLDISRISRKRLKLEKETVSLQHIISQSVSMAEPGIAAKNHTLSVHMPKETIWLVGDPIRLEQILVNILVNATKYTDSGGRININCDVEEDVVIIRIKDDGIGIDPRIIGRIFEPFLQGNKNDTHSGGGMGIGLSLTKRLVELHNGNIIAQSAGPGRGSEFIVTLPIPHNIVIPLGITPETEDTFLDEVERAKYDLPSKQAATSISPPATPKYRILVVDDNVAAAEGIRQLLRYRGHIAEAVHDGPSTLEVVRKFAPHVVILDIGLPIMDGYEVAREIRKNIQENTTLIALTGYGQEEDKMKAWEAGFDHHLTKPASLADIENILKNLE